MQQIITNDLDISKKIMKGCSIPSIGLGTYRLKGQQCIDGIRDAIDLGYRLFDTAQAYENEAAVGKGLTATGIDRKECFLSDKVWFDRLDPKPLKDSVLRSLEALQTDYLDLLMIHWPDPQDRVSLKETFAAMHELKLEGKIHWVGVSNFTPELLKESLTYEEIICNQVEYHPFLSQEKLLKMSAQFKVFLMAYSPIARGKVGENSVIRDIAQKHGKSPVQVTLRWLLQQRPVLAIPRSSDHDHRKANIDVFDFKLDETEMEKIAALHRGERLIDPDYSPEWNR